MKCLITCAGYGTRLKPLTDDCPKPLLDVNGKPLVQWIIDHLKNIGIKEIYINCQKQDLDRFIKELKDVDMFIPENEPTGTGGATRLVMPFVGKNESFYVIHGDTIFFGDLAELESMHNRNKAIATLMVHLGESNSLIEISEWGRIVRFWERNEKRRSGWVNSGVYLFSPEIFKYIPEGKSDLPKDVFEPLFWPDIKVFRFYVCPTADYRIAIDSIERLEQARKDL